LSMPELKETLSLLAEAKVGTAIDMSEVVFLDTAGVTALVAGMKKAREHGIGFCLARVPPHCARVLASAGLKKALPRAAGVAEARARVLAKTRALPGEEVESAEPEEEIVRGSR
ncbi:MAG TPA: STAS domain-containing protein, partial [Planctomycetota bacterium]|nr:STAS domain-containing protein [Planctomycetota bacterium]